MKNIIRVAVAILAKRWHNITRCVICSTIGQPSIGTTRKRSNTVSRVTISSEPLHRF